MKTSILFILFTITFSINAQTPCSNGMAGQFECLGYDLISQIPLSTMNSVKANDSWGWTDPLDGKEYAIVCLNEATAFIDISDPASPIYLGQLPGESNQHTTWRDCKTYNNYAFIVSEDSGHGMQVFDLTRLRNVANPPEIFTTDALYTDFGSAHNIAINQDTGYAYALGTTTFTGGPHFVNIQDPLNPVAAGGYNGNGYSHDAYIVTYDGPDTDYTGRELLFGSNETEVVIQDVTDKSNVITISTIAYNNVNYTHQGWLTEDQRFFLLGDETDEINTGINSRTLIFDFEDLDNPQFSFEYSGPTGATDHNGYVKGDQFYLANNAAGLRVINIADIEAGTMYEEGFFDSFPANNSSGFNGSWNIYPYFESGHIVVSDRAEGFLLVRASSLAVNEFETVDTFSITPNPATNEIAIVANATAVESVAIYDALGKVVLQDDLLNAEIFTVNISALQQGMYFISVNQGQAKQLVKY